MRRQSRFNAAFPTVAFILATGFAAPAHAGLVFTEEGNDCPGFFGDSFSACLVDGSPSIVKFNAGLEFQERNDDFPSITGFEFSFTITGSENSAGIWTYMPGPEDPAVVFWSAKAGDKFSLFSEPVFDADEMKFTGTWTTPEGKGLSHLVFYDSGDFPPPPPPVPPGEVPEPLSLLLLGAGLLGLGFARRRIATS